MLIVYSHKEYLIGDKDNKNTQNINNQNTISNNNNTNKDRL